jgi:hypothetical protein
MENVEARKEAIRVDLLSNRFINGLTHRDARRIADWAVNPQGRRLLIVGPTGSGKTALIRTLWPQFEAPYDTCTVSAMPTWARPLILDHMSFGLGIPKMDRRIKKALKAWPFELPLIVTAFGDVGIEDKAWIVVRLK